MKHFVHFFSKRFKSTISSGSPSLSSTVKQPDISVTRADPAETKSQKVVSPPPTQVPEFGAWLKQQRQQRKISQQKLASALGCSSSFLSRVEACDKPPSLPMLKSLSQIWNIEENRILLLARIVPDELAEQMANNIDFILNWMHKEQP